MNCWSGFAPICQPDAPLHEHTWYGLGGPARWLLRPRNCEELVAVVARCREEGIAWRVLGRGANLLVRDTGFDGAVLLLRGEHFEQVQYDGQTVRAGAGCDFTKLVRESIERGLAGLEALAGIPGTLGGIIRMNAGGRYGEIGRFVRDVSILNPDGELTTRTSAAVGFSYRHTNLAGCVVVAATLDLAAGRPDDLRERFREIWNQKYAEQPPVSARTAGCIFKNPPGGSAGRLIDEAGLKGARVGGAEVSRRHANFIVAHNGCKSSDVLELVALVRERVAQQADISLELEVEVW